MRTTSVLLVMIVAALAAPMAAAAAADVLKDAVLLVVPERCFNTFFVDFDLFNAPCLKATISKGLGYAIILGACVVKVPQILAFLRSGSVAGVSRSSTYLELLGYLLSSLFYLKQPHIPFSAYGETLIVAAQSLVIVLMLWAYAFPGVGETAAVVAALAAAGTTTWAAEEDKLQYVQLSTAALFSMSRITQIVANVQQGSTGQLAFMTLFMNFAGSAARVFTSSQEVGRLDVLLSFALSALLNFALLGQYFWYRQAGAAPKTAAAPKTKTSAAAAAGDAAPPSSGRKSKSAKSKDQ